MVAQTLGFLDDAPGLAWAARVAGRGELDALRLRQAVRRAAPGGPRVLPGLPRAELWIEVRPGTWEALLELFRTAFPVTVVDVGFCLEEDEELLNDQVRLRRNAVTRLAVERADLVVAVARADPVGLHAFIRGYQELRDLGVPASRGPGGGQPAPARHVRWRAPGRAGPGSPQPLRRDRAVGGGPLRPAGRGRGVARRAGAPRGPSRLPCPARAGQAGRGPVPCPGRPASPVPPPDPRDRARHRHHRA